MMMIIIIIMRYGKKTGKTKQLSGAKMSCNKTELN